MKQERLPLRKDHYLFITFRKRDDGQTRTYRTDKPVRLELMDDGKEAYHVVDCGPYSYCDYWLFSECWTLTQIEEAEW